MMNWIVSTSLRLRVLVLALAVVLMIVGIQKARNAPLDVFPEFAPPLVEIQTEAPGLSTEEVESLISVPLENALNGTIGLKTIRSKSVLGLSSRGADPQGGDRPDGGPAGRAGAAGGGVVAAAGGGARSR